MEKELLGLVGAGMAMLGAEHAPPPPGAIAHGEALVELLLKFGPCGVAAGVVDASHKLWRDWCHSGMPVGVAGPYLVALPGILDRHRPSERELIETLGPMRDGPPGQAAWGATTALAALVIAKAQAAGEFEGTGLSQQIAFYLVERLVAVLLPHRELLWRLRVPITKHFSHLRHGERRAIENNPISAGGVAA